MYFAVNNLIDQLIEGLCYLSIGKIAMLIADHIFLAKQMTCPIDMSSPFIIIVIAIIGR